MTGERLRQLLGRKPAEKAEVSGKVASDGVGKRDMGPASLPPTSAGTSTRGAGCSAHAEFRDQYARAGARAGRC